MSINFPVGLDDLKKFRTFCALHCLPMSTYHAKDPDYFDDAAIRSGAVVCFMLLDKINFYFDKDGRLVGTSTECRDSWKKSPLYSLEQRQKDDSSDKPTPEIPGVVRVAKKRNRIK